ncbi:hypothetical protein D9757_015540 [Collybiopsis confluens]|uniref:Uncharacterized protein n=1 Tax=Collybiopsis confluens TaxID=2823264 RepID=A0A8H5FHB3_9AGAR|nr:hypothetical protein D9757_015540 [Collybiopsis confluens]
MAPPLEVLKKALSALKKKHRTRAEKLRQKLAKKEKRSEEDEAWLDGEANLVDEERVIDKLGNASDYEREIGRLDEEDVAWP